MYLGETHRSTVVPRVSFAKMPRIYFNPLSNKNIFINCQTKQSVAGYRSDTIARSSLCGNKFKFRRIISLSIRLHYIVKINSEFEKSILPFCAV